MAFLFGSQVYLFLRRNDLVVFTKSGQPRQILFPETMVKNLEIVDRKLFEKILREFFSHLPKQRGTIFLSHTILFNRSVKVEPQAIVEEELKIFLEVVPLPAIHIATKVIQTPSNDLFFAVNRDIYGTILAIARQYRWQIKYVVPLSLFDGFLKGQQVSYLFFSRVLKEKKILVEGNFLESEESKEIKRIPRGQYLMLGVSLFFLMGALLYTGYTFNFFPFLAKTQAKHIQVILRSRPAVVLNTPIPVSTEEATLKKEDIRIQVLNGSGIFGQAKEIKERLEALGYGNIEIGDAEGPISNEAIVIFSGEVLQEFQDEILIELKKTFSSVDTQKLPKVEGFDVSITTGGEVK